MYRTETLVRLKCGRLKKDVGPWHPHRSTAEFWAKVLTECGYTNVSVVPDRRETLDKGNEVDLNNLLGDTKF